MALGKDKQRWFNVSVSESRFAYLKRANNVFFFQYRAGYMTRKW